MQKTRYLFGKHITAIGLGAMPLSLAGRPGEKTAREVIGNFIDGGGNFIDTANVYCIDDTDVGHSERLIRKTLSALTTENDIIVATKGGLRRSKGSWDVDASPEWLKLSCEQSLRDLDTDCICLYQLHAPDPNVPLTDSVGELSRLKEEGKILHIGLCNVDKKQMEIAQGITEIFAVQNRCNVFEKKPFENGVVGKCRHAQILFIAHSPAGGHFGHTQATRSQQLLALSRKYHASPYQLMLAWLLKQGDHILPIPGASKVSSIRSSLATLDLPLDELDLEDLD